MLLSEPSPQPAIRVTDLSRRFGSTLALAPLNLAIGPGGITGLLGPNGSGKTTFLRMLAGIVPPSGGGLVVDGIPLTGDGCAVRERLAYMAGESAVYGELRGRRHLEFLLRGRDSATLERAVALARELELPVDARVRSYSHGMKRQLLFAAALAPAVGVRLLDEVSEGLDPRKRSQVIELLKRDARAGRTILLSSHHLGEVERVCDRMVFLEGGKLLADEEAADVRARAARLVRLTWPTSIGAQALARVTAALRELPIENLAARERTVVVRLCEPDPRDFLKRWAGLDLPAPAAIEYGRVSLQELFLDLYGVEGT